MKLTHFNLKHLKIFFQYIFSSQPSYTTNKIKLPSAAGLRIGATGVTLFFCLIKKNSVLIAIDIFRRVNIYTVIILNIKNTL